MTHQAKSDVPVFIPPKGFKIVESSKEAGFHPSHNFEAEPVCEGRVVELRTVTVKKKERRVLVVETAKGMRTVWNSVKLNDLFDAVKPGKSLVYIAFLGKIKLKGGRKMNNFSVAIK